MSARPAFARGPRDVRMPPEAEIEIPPPTPLPSPPTTSLVWLLLPIAFTVVGIVVIIVVGVTSASSGSSGLAGGMLITMAISLPMMLGSYVVSIAGYFSQKNSYKRKLGEREKKYKEMLQRQRQNLEHLRSQTQKALIYNDPHPSDCLELVKHPEPRRMWARVPSDEDFLALRLGLGERPFQVKIKPPQQQSPLEPDPLVQEAQDLAKEFATVAQVPVCLPVGQAGVTGLAGLRNAVLNAVRALVTQIAIHHSPHEVKIVAIYPAQEASEWEWIRWLPHVWSEDRSRRFLAQELNSAHKLLNDFYNLLSQRQLRQEQSRSGLARQHETFFVFILADPRLVERQPILPLLLKQGPALGAFSVFLADQVAALPKECRAMASLETEETAIIQRTPVSSRLSYIPDQMPVSMAAQFSRTMAPIHLRVESEDAEIPATVRLLEVLGVERVEDLDVLNRWETNDPYRSMAVPVGKRAGGKLQYLDLHERRGVPDIQSGHGPHALIAGTVGSGKSELLQSWVASLAVHFHPHQVVFVLLDFKPPGMAEALSSLPHVVNVIDLNDLDLVPRALRSLEAELARRGRLFKQAGVDHIDDYMKLYRQHDGRATEALPYLVLIVDEFTVLRDKLPETMREFVQVAIRGRAFGFRMILATQKPAGVVSPQIDANTELRLCLRVAKAEESQEVLKRPDAASLTRAGQVYMRVGEDAVFELFQSAWSGAPYAPAGYMASDPHEIKEVALDGSRRSLHLSPRPTVSQDTSTQLKAVVAYIRSTAERANISPLEGPWRPPLPKHLALESIRPPRGWDGQTWQPSGRWLCPVIGLQDDPAGQRQPLLEPDLGRRGHLFVCSGPGSDNRQILRTLVLSLALDHSPAELHLYCLDFGSLGLYIFETLPHVGAVIRRDESSRINRLFRWLMEEVSSRKRWLTQHHVGSLAEAYARGNKGEMPPALVLVVDNLAAVSDDLDIIDILARLALEGQAAGIHLILAGDQTATKLTKVLDNVALRLALQLDDVADYRMIISDCPRDLFLPRGVLGRGLFSGQPPLECQVASPISGGPGNDPEAELAALVAAMRQAWTTSGGRLPVSIGVLPTRVLLRDLLGQIDRQVACPPNAPLCVPIGLDDLTLKPINVDLAADGPHFVIAGPPQGGKTTTLLSWVLALAECFSEEMVQFFLLDSFKGSLAVLRDLPHVRGYGIIEQEYSAILKDLDVLLAQRRTARQIGARPALVVVADDVEFLTSENTRSTLSRHVSQDHPFGFHVILAGSSAEMARGRAQFQTQALSNRSGLLVGSDDLVQDAGIFNLFVPRDQAGQRLPPGRAYLVRRGQLRLVQVATPGDLTDTQEWVRRIAARRQPARD